MARQAERDGGRGEERMLEKAFEKICMTVFTIVSETYQTLKIHLLVFKK